MTHQCECIETAIRELLQGNGYDMRIIDGQLVRQLMGGIDERASD